MSTSLAGSSGGGNSSGGGGSGGVGGGGGGGGGGPCGACKFLRRKCVAGCIFAPYFDSEQGAAHFAAVHKVFGASNVSKLLLHIPAGKRVDAVVTICYEAQSRLRDPIYGCVGHIFALQQQVVNLQAELSYLQAHLAALEVPSPPSAPPLFAHPSAIISDFPAMPAAYDHLSALCDSMVYPSWTLHQRQQIEPTTQVPSAMAVRTPPPEMPSLSNADLQEMARDLLNRHAPPVTCRNQASAFPPNSF